MSGRLLSITQSRVQNTQNPAEIAIETLNLDINKTIEIAEFPRYIESLSISNSVMLNGEKYVISLDGILNSELDTIKIFKDKLNQTI